MFGAVSRNGLHKFTTSAFTRCHVLERQYFTPKANKYFNANTFTSSSHKYTNHFRSYCTAEEPKRIELAEEEPTSKVIKKEIPRERLELLQSLFLKSGAENFEATITCEHLQQTLIDIVEGQHDSVTQQIIEKVKKNVIHEVAQK